MLHFIKRFFSVAISALLLFLAFGCTQDEDVYSFVDINHIINATTGMPYSIIYNDETGRYENTTDHIISATVLSKSSMEGDSYSTAICVMGVERASTFIGKKIQEGKIDAAILFTADKKMLIFGELVGYRKNNSLDEYKSYQSVLGEFAATLELEQVEYPIGSYSRYTEYAFTQTIEFEMYLFGQTKSEKENLKNLIMQRIILLDEQINSTNPSSDVCRINNAEAEQRVAISEDTYKLLQQSKQIFEETDGAFNVAITPLSRLWSVDIAGIAKYRAIGKSSNWSFPNTLPTKEDIDREKYKTNLSKLEIFEEEGKFFAVKGISELEVDLGGIAKGYAVDLCAEILREHNVCSAQLNMSRNIYELGNYFDPEAKKIASWKVGVTNPANKHDLFKDYVCAFQVAGDISVVTSGDYERFYSFGYKV